MNKGYSLYLDVLRFSAAMVVFFSHVASQDLTDGFLWQFKAYSQTAVMIFFVMSGYVIGFVTYEKERHITDFTVARVSRLWSIVIPALLLTAICDYIGLELNTAIYTESAWPYPEGSQVLHYVLSFFLIQNLWNMDLNPGINGPFWSLTYEWMYYILFGLFYFIKSKIKWLFISLIILISGPTIVLLFPIWLLGYVLFKLELRNKVKFEQSYLKALISCAALLLIVFVGPEVREIKTGVTWMSRASIIGDYFDAILFVIHMYFSPHIINLIKPILFKYEKLIRWSASLTFALYLFHRPIIQLIAAAYDGDKSNLFYRITMIVITFLIVATIGRWCELNKTTFKKILNKKFFSHSNG
ncbi:acyltransferase family protein [Cognaticolwellia mytili]|uniref:acyltransferase family protein n=1 Tax=Cognaticolwellia mytili TaxID=1888913 RepID=UPI000A16DFC7|nr:acyltransferase [Cognaticolwellia mytili]